MTAPASPFSQEHGEHMSFLIGALLTPPPRVWVAGMGGGPCQEPLGLLFFLEQDLVPPVMVLHICKLLPFFLVFTPFCSSHRVSEEGNSVSYSSLLLLVASHNYCFVGNSNHLLFAASGLRDEGRRRSSCVFARKDLPFGVTCSGTSSSVAETIRSQISDKKLLPGNVTNAPRAFQSTPASWPSGLPPCPILEEHDPGV